METFKMDEMVNNACNFIQSMILGKCNHVNRDGLNYPCMTRITNDAFFYIIDHKELNATFRTFKDLRS